MADHTEITPDIPEVEGFDALKYRIIKAVWGFMARLSEEKFTAFANFLGAVFWYVLFSRRKYTIKAIKKHLECSDKEAKRIARASFNENCRSFLEIFRIKDFSPKESIKEVINEENLDLLLDATGPIVITTAHIGPWEFMATFMADYKPDKYKIAVVRTQSDRAIDRFMKKARSSQGMTLVGHRNTSSYVLNALNKEDALAAFLVDHNCSRKEAIFLPFLNELAAVNMGPAMLALRSKAIIFTIFLIRRKDGGHTFYVNAPLKTKELEGTVSEKINQIATYYTNACAELIKEYPEQWFWMHKRWKTRPGKKREKKKKEL